VIAIDAAAGRLARGAAGTAARAAVERAPLRQRPRRLDRRARGLLLARAGWPEGDSAAALFVAVLVLSPRDG
jgi:hypothetical protein